MLTQILDGNRSGGHRIGGEMEGLIDLVEKRSKNLMTEILRKR